MEGRTGSDAGLTLGNPRRDARLVAFSEVLAPMLLTTAKSWPSGGDWVLEPKWDGYRFVAQIEGGRARCWTRHGTDLTSRVGTLVDELVELLPDRSVIDGELIALAAGPRGVAGQDFHQLSRTIFGRGADRLWLVVFDAPQLAGEPLARRPWHERRSVLEATLPAVGAGVSLIDVFDADPAVHDRLLSLGFEGSVLKRRDGRYLAGPRLTSWRKLEQCGRGRGRRRRPREWHRRARRLTRRR